MLIDNPGWNFENEYDGRSVNQQIEDELNGTRWKHLLGDSKPINRPLPGWIAKTINEYLRGEL